METDLHKNRLTFPLKYIVLFLNLILDPVIAHNVNSLHSCNSLVIKLKKLKMTVEEMSVRTSIDTFYGLAALLLTFQGLRKGRNSSVCLPLCWFVSLH